MFAEPLEFRVLFASTPYTGTPIPLPGLIEAENFDNGGEGVGYHSPGSANLGGAYRSGGVSIQATGDSGGGYDVGWTQTGEWLLYSTSVASAGTYTLNVRVADAMAGGTFHVEVDGTNVSGEMSVPNTGGWQNWVTLTTTGISLSAGTHLIKLMMDSQNNGYVGNFNWLQFASSTTSVPPFPPPITTPGQTAYGGTPAPLPGTIQAENFDNGGEGVGYHSSSTVNLGGAYRSGGVSIETTGDTGGGYDVGWVHAGDWLVFTTNVVTAGTYTLSTRVADATAGGNFHVEVDGVNVSGELTVPNTGGWQNWTTLSKSGISLAAGSHLVKLVMDSQSNGYVGNFNWLQFASSSGTSPAPTPTSTSTPFSGTPAAVPGTVEAENFDNGGEGVAYHSANTSNPGGAYRSGGVGIEATGDNGGGYDIGWTHAGDYLDYTINVPTAGVYYLNSRVASAGNGGTFHVEFNGTGVFTNLTGAITIPSTGGWQNFTTLTKTGISLPAGTYVMKVIMDSSGQSGLVGNFNWFRLNAGTPEVAKNLLFFGNSFTAYNNLPSIVSQIAVADGHVTPNVFTQAVFGWTLSDHLNQIASDGSNNIIVHSLPAGAAWSDVVIQDYSTRPLSVTAAPINGNPTGFRSDAATLFQKVHANSPGVTDVLFETWARGPLNPFYPGSYPNPPAMQNDLLANYNLAASDANTTYATGTATVAHVGEAWRGGNFAANLYDGTDEYHPSPRGSVLAGLVLFRTIYHQETATIPAANVSALLASDGLTASDWTGLTAVADAAG